MTGFVELENKKIIKLKNVTLYPIPLRFFSEKADFDYESLCVSGTIVEGVTIASTVFDIWPSKGITRTYSGFCADKVILENELMKIVIGDIEFTTPFENGRIGNIEFHGNVSYIEYRKINEISVKNNTKK